MHDLTPFKTESKQVAEWLSREYSQIHTGRAAPALLDGVQVEAYGTMQPLKNLASVAIEDPKTLRVAPWDKSQNKEIERALHAANLGFSIVVDDGGVRVIVPSLTTETRNNLVKVAKERLEDARIRVRKAREAALGKMKDAKLSEDALERAKNELQKLVDEANAELEKHFEQKETEILS
ncbi:MAG TPA: ribosome recycling factor [Candidatus Paceibacterota bacterium]|jgi:ribosome recycling factor|nr:ribosome recycling factor [Candidatus Paceibacterota bacterium]